MPTTNPVPSQDPSDLLFNSGKLDEVLNGTGNSFTDRLGVARRTVAGMNADFDAQLADAESDLNVYLADAAASAAQALGYLNTIRTTSYGAYAIDPATDPLGNPPTVGDEYFNTTANLLKRWNGTTWQASDINTANLAAPSGSSLVGYDGQTVQDVLDGAKAMQSYAALRNYTGRATGVHITTPGIAGFFQRLAIGDPDYSAADNSGTIIVDASGRRWKRLYSGGVNVLWFMTAAQISDVQSGSASIDVSGALQAAFAVSTAAHAPKGSYQLGSATAVSTQWFKLTGDGKSNTKFVVSNTTGGITFSGQYQTVEDIGITCSAPGGSGYGIKLMSPYFSAYNCNVDQGTTKFANCLLIPEEASAWVKYFENCLFANSSSDAFYVPASNLNHAVFVACTFRGSGRDGFRLDGMSSHGVFFHGCRAENNNSGAGFRIAGRRGNHVSFEGVYLEHNDYGIYAGNEAPAWSTVDDYMELCSVSDMTCWEQDESALVVYKCKQATLDGALIGSGTAGKFASDAVNAAWSGTPFANPQLIVKNIGQRGSVFDYTLLRQSVRLMVESANNTSYPTTILSAGPSTGTVRPSSASLLSGAYASRNVTLGVGVDATQVLGSAISASNCNLGQVKQLAVIGSSSIDLTTANSASQLGAVLASDYSGQSADAIYRSALIASSYTLAKNSNTVVGGFGYTTPTTANRKWEINSVSGNVTIAGALSSGATFSDFAEMFENGEGKEIPPGTLVTLKDDAVVTANPGDDISGVISATAAVVAGDSAFCWSKRYVFDDWGRPVMEDIQVYAAESDSYQTVSAQKENHEWDSTLENVPRSMRPDEWCVVGMLGQVLVRVDEHVKPGDRVKAGLGGIGTVSDAGTGLRCMKLVKPYSPDGYAIAKCAINVSL